jgi:AcrR family transcriptional regulator
MTDPSTSRIAASVPRRSRTRDALLAAGAALLAERPVDAIAIDEIVAAAGVAKGSFYNHFADKAALAFAVGEAIRADVEARVGAANAAVTDPAERLVRGVCVYVDFALADTTRSRVMARGLAADPSPGKALTAGLRADLARGLTVGRFALPTVDAGAQFVVGVANALLGSVAQANIDRAHAVAQAQALGTLLLKGLGLASDDAAQIAAQAAHDVIAVCAA